ncbi:MAG: DUF2948 family protein [Pseudomonadota bacterium]
MSDATFQDGREAPLNLGAEDADDLQILSSLCQDAVFPITEMRFDRAARTFALLVNRFRWEDGGRERHGAERVQSVLAFEDVQRVASQGIDRADKDMVLSLLSVAFEPGEDGTGAVILTLAGDGAIRLEVEALSARLRDVTRPYKAPAGKAPDHPE